MEDCLVNAIDPSRRAESAQESGQICYNLGVDPNVQMSLIWDLKQSDMLHKKLQVFKLEISPVQNVDPMDAKGSVPRFKKSQRFVCQHQTSARSHRLNERPHEIVNATRRDGRYSNRSFWDGRSRGENHVFALYSCSGWLPCTGGWKELAAKISSKIDDFGIFWVIQKVEKKPLDIRDGHLPSTITHQFSGNVSRRLDAEI